MYPFVFTIFIFINSFLFYSSNDNQLKPGEFKLGNAALLDKESYLIKGKKIGLITNTSGVLSNGDLFLDSLNQYFEVVKVFTPEHGLRGDDRNENYSDEKTGVPVVSLYGSKKKPDPADLENVDVLVYDIQDVGARFYTFINTMYYCMESAVENNKGMIICDRPMIPYGNYVDGFMLNERNKSFVGLIDVPAAYGMTCGELATFINAEYFDGKCILNVVMMNNYLRETDYTTFGLPWIKPSPNIYFPSSALCYLGTCLFEGTNFAEGRGTDKPFEYIGAPYCDGKILADEMNSYGLKGVFFESISFTPGTITSNSNPPKYIGELCGGVYLNVKDKNIFEPVKSVIAVLVSLKKLFPEFRINSNNFLDKLAGSDVLRIMLNNGNSYEEIVGSFSAELTEFRNKRSQYLLYK